MSHEIRVDYYHSHTWPAPPQAWLSIHLSISLLPSSGKLAGHAVTSSFVLLLLLQLPAFNARLGSRRRRSQFVHSSGAPSRTFVPSSLKVKLRARVGPSSVRSPIWLTTAGRPRRGGGGKINESSEQPVAGGRERGGCRRAAAAVCVAGRQLRWWFCSGADQCKQLRLPSIFRPDMYLAGIVPPIFLGTNIVANSVHRRGKIMHVRKKWKIDSF